MNRKIHDRGRMTTAGRLHFLPLALLASLMLAGCGGTKVYESTKTVVYRDSLYNVSNVQSVTKRITGKLSDTETQSLLNVDRRGFDQLVKEHGAIYVRMSFLLDEQELVYRASKVDSGRDFQRMRKDFDDAGKDIVRLMADKKKTQIELH